MPRGCAPRIMRFAIVATCVLLCPVSRAAADDAPGCGVMVVPLRGATVAYQLPHTFIRAGSDSAWTRTGALRRGHDYVLDAVRGELRLLRAAGAGDTLWMHACWLLSPPPVDLQLNAFHPLDETDDSVRVSKSEPVRRPSTGRSVGEAPAGASLSITGNKTLAVDFGSSQDAFLRQSLDLAVSGTLAPGVEITGVLTDRNTPVTASGTTQDLQSLDQVLVELKAPGATATLGDLTLDVTEGEFSRLQRRLQGVRGTFERGPARVAAAAASAQGEYNRLQFFGVEGRQGPYTLTDRDGRPGVSVVAESEVVSIDGERLVRGESADYSIDYEKAQLTFSNRRPVTFGSRITVEYQYTVNRFRRNLAAAGGRWARGNLFAFTQVITEGDDRGRPLDLSLSDADRMVLQFAGDSAASAVGAGVTSGGGDYDTVRVSGGDLAFAFAGPDSGEFGVVFTLVGTGAGSYADSTVVGGRSVFRYVGPGTGTHEVGRGLPMPESHQLWSVGGGAGAGPVALEIEAALSNRDRNTFSAFDDGDNVGHAGRAALSLKGRLPGWLQKGGVRIEGRSVGERFTPFSRLERPFAQEDWGLPVNADFERQDRVVVSADVTPRTGGEFRAHVGALRTPFGFSSVRQGAEWLRDGTVSVRALWERSDGEQDDVQFREGGRERMRGEVRWRLPWIEPAVRAESDERRFPSDSARSGDRFREAGMELRTGRAFAWQALGGFSLRRDALLRQTGFEDQSDVATTRLRVESPRGRGVSGAVQYQGREVRPLGNAQRSRSDLASVRLSADDAARGLRAGLNVEVTAEGENRRDRTVVFVGPGQGTYDAFGNFVGTGDYDLVLSVSQALERISRTATSARVAWTFGQSDAWRGSRTSFDFESEARRRGELKATDGLVSPDAALGDATLARASLLQRLETELAPASPAAAVRVRLERRINADRSFQNFAQTVDDRQASIRWRTRPGALTSTEIEARTQKQVAVQTVSGGASSGRVLFQHSGSGRLIYTPGAHLRAVAAAEATWSRPAGQSEWTRSLRMGPEVGVTVGSRGRLELTARRGFLSGPPAVGILPTADPVGAPEWDGTARFDYRLRQSTTFSVSYAVRKHPDRRAQANGRAELRAFF